MPLQAALLTKALAALTARAWFLICVNSKVYIQGSYLTIALVALIACVWLITRVNSNVHVQVANKLKSLAAVRALVRSLVVRRVSSDWLAR